MATNEVSGFLKYKDEAGNLNLLLPITTKDNIDGLDELEQELLETVKFTPQDLTDEQKAQARANIGVGDVESAEAIIDVISLPESDINENVFYRLLTGSLVINQVVQNAYTCHCVDELPPTGLPATNIEQTEGNVYYTVSDGELYGYVDDTLSAALSVPVGWYPAATLLGALDFGYSGVITNIMNDPKDGNFRLLLEYVVHSYKDGWTSHKTIGWAGTGPSAEIFNDPMNIASGIRSHAEGNHTYAEGDSSHAEGDHSHARGYSSHAEGNHTQAIGNASHAEGAGLYTYRTIISESKVDGQYTYGLDLDSTGTSALRVGTFVDYESSDGTYVSAKMISVDAETGTIIVDRSLSDATTVGGRIRFYIGALAFGRVSHSEGLATIAAGRSQHTQGEYNIVDPEYDATDGTKRGKYAHIVGNGSDNNRRSNAHTLDWNGMGWFQGGLQVGGTEQDGEGAGYVPAIPSASVGQIVAVKAVDENGRPTEWEAVDMPTGSGTAELPDNVVTCDLEGATEDETPMHVDADTLAGRSVSEFALISISTVDAVNDFVLGKANCIRVGNIRVIQAEITVPTISSDAWYQVANVNSSDLGYGGGRTMVCDATGSVHREFSYNSGGIWASLRQADSGKCFYLNSLWVVYDQEVTN